MKKLTLPHGQYISYNKLSPYFKSKNSQNLTKLVLTLIALCFFGLFAISPTLTTITELEKEIKDYTSLNEQLTEKINNMRTLGELYTKIKSDIPVIETALPINPEATALLGKIQTLLKENNLSVNEFKTQEVELSKSFTSKQAIQELPSSFLFTIKLTGHYKDFMSFLDTLTKTDRITTLDKISFSKAQTDSSQPDANLLLLTIMGRAYFKK